MAALTGEEALAFVEALQASLQGKAGFKWFVDRLSSLASYIESTSAENELMSAYIDSAGVRNEYDTFAAANPKK